MIIKEYPEIGKIYQYFPDGRIEIVPMHKKNESRSIENIDEVNKVIAVFIGYRLDEALPFDKGKYYRRRNHIELITRLPFHKDWNLLMEAVIKIERLGIVVNMRLDGKIDIMSTWRDVYSRIQEINDL